MFNLFVYSSFFIIIIIQIGLINCQTDRIRLSDVQTITLNRGKFTTGRRVAAVPQLTCIGGSAGCSYQPSTVQCYNRGTDGQNVQWECKAELPESIQFGEMKVTCEGYNDKTDPYILVGSCGLEYKLQSANDSTTNTAFSLLIFFIALSIIIFIICVIVDSKTKRTNSTVLPTYTSIDDRYRYSHNYNNYRSSVSSFKLSSGFASSSNR